MISLINKNKLIIGKSQQKTILAIFVVGLFTFLLVKNYRPVYEIKDQLFAQYYTPYILNKNFKTNYIVDDKLQSVARLHDDGKYCEAFNLLVTLNQDKIDSSLVSFIYGHIYMGMNNYENSNSAFTGVIYSSNDNLADDAHWYRGLSLLKCGYIKEAQEDFELLCKNDTIYKDKALDILSRMVLKS